jgi:hypothetical protein
VGRFSFSHDGEWLAYTAGKEDESSVLSMGRMGGSNGRTCSRRFPPKRSRARPLLRGSPDSESTSGNPGGLERGRFFCHGSTDFHQSLPVVGCRG